MNKLLQTFFLLVFIVIFVSCSKNNDEVKRKELELKEKELELKEREMNIEKSKSQTGLLPKDKNPDLNSAREYSSINLNGNTPGL
ncbi:MAG: hypothetical protein K1X86_00260 [Ignavibacteria bacterium]|nr:hypothetical protein [Ignavibacteria bacterium]